MKLVRTTNFDYNQVIVPEGTNRRFAIGGEPTRVPFSGIFSEIDLVNGISGSAQHSSS